MKILIMGMGNVGSALAQGLKRAGHTVAGTTTSDWKRAQLQAICEDVYVLKGHETKKVQQAAKDCDLIVVTVAPNVQSAKTIEERQESYRQTLVESCQSAVDACPRVVFLSSFSVYGDGGVGHNPIDEQTKLDCSDEPSSVFYQLAEKAVLTSNSSCVLRLPDIYGAPGDLDFSQRVKLGHQIMGGKVPFGPDAPLYCIHYLDVVSATIHAIEQGLNGVFNVCENDKLPQTNKEIFDHICRRDDLPLLQFLNHIKTPNRKISSKKLMDTGFKLSYHEKI